jgi:hypothetical protein
MEEKVKRFLDTLGPKKRRLAMRVRAIVLESHPSIKEDIKWGNLTFISNGNIAFVYAYDTVDYINLGFFKATQLSDPKKLFEGTGKGMRHVKLHDEEEINHEQIKAWVREAVRLNKLSMKSISR